MRRRFIAFITLIISAIVILIGNFTNVFTEIHTGTEFNNGYSYVYNISASANSETEVDIKEAASEMNRRLKNAEINDFDISIEGENQIRVTFTGSNASEAEHIKKLLSYNAVFSLTTTDDVQQAEGADIFEGSVARVEFRNQYPIIVIPISDKYKVETVREHALTCKDESASSESGESSDSIDLTMIILWANKVEGESFENAIDSDNPDHEKIQEKVLLAFSSSEDSFYYNDEHTEIAYAMNVSTDETTGEINKLDAKQKAIEAHRKADLFNAGSLDYDVTFLYDTPADASVENLINYGNYANVNWSSKIVISTIVGIVLVSILLVIYYKINSLVAITTTGASLLTTLAIFNIFGVEFSIGALMGLLVIAALGLFSNVYYFEKLKNELYRGRNLKKANAEASKRSTLPIIDASVIVLLASLITFFVGEPLVKAFAVMSALGTICNLIFCLIGTKGLMWLLANDTWMQKNKSLLCVDESKIPNTQNEEKQTYFGTFDEKNIAKNSKKVGIAATIITVLGIALTLVFNFTIGTFNYDNNYASSTRIQLVVEDNSDINKVETLANDLINLGFDIDDSTLNVATGTKDVNDTKINLNYFVVDIISLPGDDSVIYNDLNTYEGDKLLTIQAYLEAYYQGIDSDAEVKVMNVTPIAHTVNPWNVALGILFGLLLSGVYMALRYGLSKSISSFIVGVASTFATLALFIICRITFTDVAAIGLLAIMNISLLLSLLFNSREKDIHDEVKDFTAEEKMIKANDSAFGSMFNLVIFNLFIALSLLAFGPASYNIVFVLVIIGLLISLLFNSSLTMSLYIEFTSLFRKIKVSKPQRKNKDKKKKKVEQKTTEPEEAIFIGIND